MTNEQIALAEERGREESLLMIIGTPYNNPPPFDLFDFLVYCLCCIEWQYLRNVRHGAPRACPPGGDE